MASSPLKNLFRFMERCYHTMIENKLLTSALERRRTFDSPLANHFSPVMQISR